MKFRSRIESPTSQTASLRSTADNLIAELRTALCVYDACKKERRQASFAWQPERSRGTALSSRRTLYRSADRPDRDAGLGAFYRLQADGIMFSFTLLCCVGAAWLPTRLPCLTAASRIRSSLGATLASPRHCSVSQPACWMIPSYQILRTGLVRHLLHDRSEICYILAR